MKVFKSYRLFEIIILGILSGMPQSIIFSTFGALLKERGVALDIITTFAVARLPYSAKFLWSPFVDYLQIPILKSLGRRKSWMILCTSCVIILLFSISLAAEKASLPILRTLLILLGFFAATFDIVFDAFRIERFDKNLQGIAVSNTILGYRLGMLITSSGALYFAHITNDWSKVFTMLAIIFTVFLIFLLTVREDNIIISGSKKLADISLSQSIVEPFKDFFKKDKALFILLIIILFKLGDAMLGIISMPFYLELGYSKQQIAIIVKGFGVVATLAGSYFGGFIVAALGRYQGLIISAIIQSLTHIAFIWLNAQQGEENALAIAITIENFGAGVGSTAFVSYISMLCNKNYSATQYALFSSLASFANDTVVISGGSLALKLGWNNYFIFTMILALPAILLLMYLHYQDKQSELVKN